MLTVEINDSRLEKSLAEKARAIGKSTQEIVKDLLLKALPETKTTLSYKKLDPRENGYVIDTDLIDNIILAEDTNLYTQVDDSAKYTEELRKKSWRK